MEDRKVFLMPRVKEADFPSLRALMKNEAGFPATFDQWHVYWATRQQQEQAKGFRPAYLDVSVTAFHLFLAARKTNASWAALAAYMAAIAHR